MNEVLKVLSERSSTRAYEAEMLTEEQICTLVTAGLQAPTAVNKQELHFTVAKCDNADLVELNNDLTGGKSCFYYGAPVVILISGDSSFSWSTLDAGIAVENIHIAAESMGLGSVVLGCINQLLHGEKQKYYSKKFCFPEGYDFKIAIAVGKKAAGKEPHSFEASKQVTCL